jgi:hypothetical protein
MDLAGHGRHGPIRLLGHTRPLSEPSRCPETSFVGRTVQARPSTSSSRRSSTAQARTSGVDRRTPPAVRNRADVRRAHLSTASRSPHLLRSRARATSTRGLRDAEVVALIAEARDARSGSGSCLRVVAASARTSRDVARSTERLMTAPGSASALAGQEGPHHHWGRGGCAAGCSGRPGLHPNCAEPAVGRGLHLRFRPGRARSLGPSSSTCSHVGLPAGWQPPR